MIRSMTLTKERKVLLGLLGSAGIILLADQVLLSPPQGAQAAAGVTPANPSRNEPDTPARTASDTSTPLPTSPDASTITRWNALARKRAEAQSATPPADPFSSSYEPGSAIGAPSAQAFVGAHQLTAVLAAGEQSLAMVNGKSVRLGESVGGYRLVRVDARSAEFVAGEVVVRLSLPGDGPGGP